MSAELHFPLPFSLDYLPGGPAPGPPLSRRPRLPCEGRALSAEPLSPAFRPWDARRGCRNANTCGSGVGQCVCGLRMKVPDPPASVWPGHWVPPRRPALALVSQLSQGRGGGEGGGVQSSGAKRNASARPTCGLSAARPVGPPSSPALRWHRDTRVYPDLSSEGRSLPLVRMVPSGRRRWSHLRK